MIEDLLHALAQALSAQQDYLRNRETYSPDPAFYYAMTSANAHLEGALQSVIDERIRLALNR